jgi:predicted anti-sigma-YlaC factor YlaD
MHSCERFREALSARIDGEEPGITGSVIDAHLDTCSECRAWASTAAAFGGFGDVSDTPPLRPAVMNEILARSATLNERQRPLVSWRVALALIGALQLVVVWLGLVLDDAQAADHTSRELASWDLGLAVGFLVLAWFPWRAWGALPVVAVMVAFLAGTSLHDLLVGETTVGQEAAHMLQVAGLLCLWQIARRMPRSSVVLRLNSP